MHDMTARDLECPCRDHCMICRLMTSEALISKINFTLSANQKRDGELNL